MPDRRYARIVDELRTRITSRQLAPGEPVPSARAIMREWGVALATATRVLAVLRDEGLVDTRPGVGTVVAKRPARRRSRQTSDADITEDRIVAKAIDIADAEGLAAVSMRRIAIELGVPTMAMYRRVRGKNGLLLAMADTVLGQVQFPEPRPRGWRAQLQLLARLQWAGYQRHPWLARIVSMTRPTVLPNGMTHTEWALSAVDDLNLDSNTMLHVAVNLFAFVRASATNVEMELESEQDTGLTDDQWLESQGTHFARVLASGRYPHLARVIASPEVDLDLDTLFEFGLERVLDGYAALFNARHSQPQSTVA